MLGWLIAHIFPIRTENCEQSVSVYKVSIVDRSTWLAPLDEIGSGLFICQTWNLFSHTFLRMKH